MSDHYIEYSSEEIEEMRQEQAIEDAAAEASYSAWQEYEVERNYHFRVAESYPHNDAVRKSVQWLERFADTKNLVF